MQLQELVPFASYMREKCSKHNGNKLFCCLPCTNQAGLLCPLLSVISWPVTFSPIEVEKLTAHVYILVCDSYISLSTFMLFVARTNHWYCYIERANTSYNALH